MISDREIWQCAPLVVKRYGADAMLEAAARADQLQEDGDWEGAVTWHRILNAIERLQATKPAEEEAGEQLFTFLRFPPEQWRSIRTTNAIERLGQDYFEIVL